MIENIIYNENINIKYITKEERNPEYTREVNECYYIILASICFSVTSDEIKLTESFNFDNNNVEINLYCNILKEINNIMQNLNNDLYIYLNEMYIIDELKEIIELQRLKKIDIDTIEEIREYLRKSSLIIQNNQPDKIEELIVNFQNIYDLLTSEEIKFEEDKNYYNKYYDTLRYIFFKEINKVDDTIYCCKILEKLLQEKEIIKKSNNIFDILLKSYISVNTGKKGFKKNISTLSKGDDKIINLIEKKLKESKEENYFVLSETLLYFFEKNSIIYLKNALYNQEETKLLEKEPLEIFIDCVNLLDDFINNPKKLEEKDSINYITKLYSLGYIKVYCFTFIKMFDEPEPKFKEPEKIIDFVNENKLNNMIKLYIYKILFKQEKLDVFLNPNSIKKYKLEKYEGFKDFIKFPEEEQINYGVETLDNENYENIYKVIEKYKKENFKKQIQKDELDYEILNIDNFYIASYNSILSHLKRKEFEKSDVFDNFYKNICKPLFEKDKLSNIIQLFYNPREYEKIKNDFGIDSINIEAILYGYRFCLNELSDENKDGIYYPLYTKENINYLTEKFYPGSDTRDEPYYELYSKIINHFKERKNEGCYVCLCNKGFYHSVSSGFPDIQEKNRKCPNCSKDIGILYKEKNLAKKYEIVKRDKYFRIFKDNEEIETLKKNKDKRKKLEEINYMTLNEFKEKYIQKLFNHEKGLPSIDKNYFKKDNKIIRNLSQISYRLLNYILYSHLFFARILTKTNRYDNYLPKGMNWGETLNECWNQLNHELKNKGINKINIFMNFTFKELFYKLHDREYIDKYDDLFDFEKDLEQLIQEKVVLSQEECEKYKKLMNQNNEDKNSSINLLTEKYESQNYPKEEYPYYEYFYYCNYLDEKYIIEKLSHMDDNKYPILKKYLEYQNTNRNESDDYSLDNLYLFNTVLNLFSEKYAHQVTREYAEKSLLKEDEIYQSNQNKQLINDFIKFYNKLKIKCSIDDASKDVEDKDFIELNADKNHLCDFFIDDNNEIGKTYKDIYKKFIKKQNDEVETLLDIKIISGVFDSNCTNKINVQQIRKEEIFTIKLPENFSFNNIIFNSSYRKIIDNKNFEIYNQYEINFNSIEGTLTDLILKNKKLLNEEIIEFSYNNEVFNNVVKDLITSFKNNYNTVEINPYDKEIIYFLIEENENNKALYKTLINDFITLLQYLNDLKKEVKENKDDNISENSKIYEVFEKLENNISKEFLSIFEEKEELTVNKTSELFEYFLKTIFKYVKEDIKDYQEELDEKELENKKNKLEEYYQKDSLIKKEDFESAIRLFLTLVLFREEDKENKIKSNPKNIVTYLKAVDLWDKNIYTDKKFIENLNELKNINIQINQILIIVDIIEEDISYIKEDSNIYSEIREIEKESQNESENESESYNNEEERE